jgi:hypothetical protein
MEDPPKKLSADQFEISKPAAKYSSQNTKLIVPLVITAIVMLIGMSLYQLLKLLLLPNISLIQKVLQGA